MGGVLTHITPLGYAPASPSPILQPLSVWNIFDTITAISVNSIIGTIIYLSIQTDDGWMEFSISFGHPGFLQLGMNLIIVLRQKYSKGREVLCLFKGATIRYSGEAWKIRWQKIIYFMSKRHYYFYIFCNVICTWSLGANIFSPFLRENLVFSKFFLAPPPPGYLMVVLIVMMNCIFIPLQEPYNE